MVPFLNDATFTFDFLNLLKSSNFGGSVADKRKIKIMPAVGYINLIYLGLFIMTLQCNRAVRADIRTVPIGFDKGLESWTPTVVKKIGMTESGLVTQIRINGIPHGSSLPGAKDLGSLTLGKEEYISKIEYLPCTEAFIYGLKFVTNIGRSIGAPFIPTNVNCGIKSLDNIRVLAIGGRNSNVLLKLEVLLIDDYKPSSRQATNVGFIISYSAPYQEFEEYSDSSYRTLDSLERVTEHMLTQTYSASIEGEYMAKASLSSSIEIKDSNIETVKKEIEQQLKSGSKKKQTIPGGYVGVKLVKADLMKGDDGSYWMFPTSKPSYSVINMTEIDGLLGYYDLTGVLYTQMQGLKPYKTVQNGYVYYRERK